MRAYKEETVRRRDRGVSLLMVAVSLVVVLGFMALAIDLASLYVAHTEAQHAADAAALAGAKGIVDSGYLTLAPSPSDLLSILLASAFARNYAQNEAVAVARQNKIVGQQLPTGNISVTFPNGTPVPATPPLQPQVRVAVGPVAVPTFFGKIFGRSTVNISAIATAAAYNPSGSSGAPIAVTGLKPWVFGNLDPTSAAGTTSCSGANAGRLINPTTGAICRPGQTNLGGIVGKSFNLAQGNPSAAPARSKFYILQTSGTTIAPSCAAGDSYSQALAGTNTTRVQTATTATVSLTLSSGANGALTENATRCLIHATGNGLGNGQDSMFLNFGFLGFNLWPLGGSNNPIPGANNNAISRSDSIITVPIYNDNSTPLCAVPGCTGTQNVTIIGFLQLFINNTTTPTGTVNVTVMNVVGSPSATGTPVVAPSGSPIPVRLIQ